MGVGGAAGWSIPAGIHVSLVQASLRLTGCLIFQKNGTGEGQKEKKCLIRTLKV